MGEAIAIYAPCAYAFAGVGVFLWGLVESIQHKTLRTHVWALPVIFVVIVAAWPTAVYETKIMGRRALEKIGGADG